MSLIAQKNHRETEASGLGWELFSQYVRALREAKPKFFIYENNKSMSKEIRDSIRETFGFDEICINSALVSAQNRQRYYWVGKRNEDGTYSRVNVQQPNDRGILMKDVLDKSNLRVTNHSTNQMNTQHKGVSLRNDGRWYAYIKKNQRMLNLGIYAYEQEALYARWVAEQALFGEYAYPKEEPGVLDSRRPEIKAFVEQKVQRLQ